jgi:hypothetical protein
MTLLLIERCEALGKSGSEPAECETGKGEGMAKMEPHHFEGRNGDEEPIGRFHYSQ